VLLKTAMPCKRNAFLYLLAEGLDLCRVNCDVMVNYNRLVVIYPKDLPVEQPGLRISNDFTSTLVRAIDWARNNKGLRGKEIQKEALLRSLAQVCVIKKKASAEAVIEHFMRMGVVSVDPASNLLRYNLQPVGKGMHSAYMALQS